MSSNSTTSLNPHPPSVFRSYSNYQKKGTQCLVQNCSSKTEPLTTDANLPDILYSLKEFQREIETSALPVSIVTGKSGDLSGNHRLGQELNEAISVIMTELMEEIQKSGAKDLLDHVYDLHLYPLELDFGETEFSTTPAIRLSTVCPVKHVSIQQTKTTVTKPNNGEQIFNGDGL